MLDYQFLFNVLVAFLLGYLFKTWLNDMEDYKECNKCKGKGYVRK